MRVLTSFVSLISVLSVPIAVKFSRESFDIGNSGNDRYADVVLVSDNCGSGSPTFVAAGTSILQKSLHQEGTYVLCTRPSEAVGWNSRNNFVVVRSLPSAINRSIIAADGVSRTFSVTMNGLVASDSNFALSYTATDCDTRTNIPYTISANSINFSLSFNEPRNTVRRLSLCMEGSGGSVTAFPDLFFEIAGVDAVSPPTLVAGEAQTFTLSGAGIVDTTEAGLIPEGMPCTQLLAGGRWTPGEQRRDSIPNPIWGGPNFSRSWVVRLPYFETGTDEVNGGRWGRLKVCYRMTTESTIWQSLPLAQSITLVQPRGMSLSRALRGSVVQEFTVNGLQMGDQVFFKLASRVTNDASCAHSASEGAIITIGAPNDGNGCTLCARDVHIDNHFVQGYGVYRLCYLAGQKPKGTQPFGDNAGGVWAGNTKLAWRIAPINDRVTLFDDATYAANFILNGILSPGNQITIDSTAVIAQHPAFFGAGDVLSVRALTQANYAHADYPNDDLSNSVTAGVKGPTDSWCRQRPLPMTGPNAFLAPLGGLRIGFCVQQAGSRYPIFVRKQTFTVEGLTGVTPTLLAASTATTVRATFSANAPAAAVALRVVPMAAVGAPQIDVLSPVSAVCAGVPVATISVSPAVPTASVNIGTAGGYAVCIGNFETGITFVVEDRAVVNPPTGKYRPEDIGGFTQGSKVVCNSGQPLLDPYARSPSVHVVRADPRLETKLTGVAGNTLLTVASSPIQDSFILASIGNDRMLTHFTVGDSTDQIEAELRANNVDLTSLYRNDQLFNFDVLDPIPFYTTTLPAGSTGGIKGLDLGVLSSFKHGVSVGVHGGSGQRAFLHVVDGHRVRVMSSQPPTASNAARWMDGAFRAAGGLAAYGGAAAGRAYNSLNNPRGVVVARGFVYVADTGNGRVVVLERDTLKLIGQIAVANPVSVAFVAPHFLFVASSSAAAVQSFTVHCASCSEKMARWDSQVGSSWARFGGQRSTATSPAGVADDPVASVDQCKRKCLTSQDCGGFTAEPIDDGAAAYGWVRCSYISESAANKLATNIAPATVAVYRITRPGMLVTLRNNNYASHVHALTSKDNILIGTSNQRHAIIWRVNRNTGVLQELHSVGTGVPIPNNANTFSSVAVSGRHVAVTSAGAAATTVSIFAISLNQGQAQIRNLNCAAGFASAADGTAGAPVGDADASASVTVFSAQGSKHVAVPSSPFAVSVEPHSSYQAEYNRFSKSSTVGFKGRLPEVTGALYNMGLIFKDIGRYDIEVSVGAEGGSVGQSKLTVLVGDSEVTGACPVSGTGDVCSKRGSCNVSTGDVCQCDPPFLGASCERKACKRECLNGSGCDFLTGTCLCLPGFSGLQCELFRCVDDCNGRGHCVPEEKRCMCTVGWEGEACELRSAEGTIQ